jgi:hypothetical protein
MVHSRYPSVRLVTLEACLQPEILRWLLYPAVRLTSSLNSSFSSFDTLARLDHQKFRSIEINEEVYRGTHASVLFSQLLAHLVSAVKGSCGFSKYALYTVLCTRTIHHTIPAYHMTIKLQKSGVEWYSTSSSALR